MGIWQPATTCHVASFSMLPRMIEPCTISLRNQSSSSFCQKNNNTILSYVASIQLQSTPHSLFSATLPGDLAWSTRREACRPNLARMPNTLIASCTASRRQQQTVSHPDPRLSTLLSATTRTLKKKKKKSCWTVRSPEEQEAIALPEGGAIYIRNPRQNPHNVFVNRTCRHVTGVVPCVCI